MQELADTTLMLVTSKGITSRILGLHNKQGITQRYILLRDRIVSMHMQHAHDIMHS